MKRNNLQLNLPFLLDTKAMTHSTPRGKSEKGACSQVYRDVIESDESFEERLNIEKMQLLKARVFLITVKCKVITKMT